MRRIKFRPNWILSVVLAGAGCVGLPAAAQDEGVVLDVRFGGLSNIQPHEKDADAYRALMMLGERLAEIPNEAGGPDEARVGIELLWDLFRGAHALRIEQTQEAPGMSFAFTLSPELPLDGKSYLDKFAQFSMATGGPIEEDGEGDGYVLSTPIGNATLQSMDVAGRSSMVVRMGAKDAAQTPVNRFDLPSEAEPILSAQLHLQRLGQFLAQMISEEDPDFAEIIEEHRWVIDEAPLLNIAYGTSRDHQYLTSRIVGGKAWLGRLGMDPEHSFGREQFAVIPQDATLVSVFPFDLGFLVDLIEWAAEREGQDPFGELEEQLGFDIRGDVLENVGPRMIYYQSDATGGGGLLSAVIIAELRDPGRLAQTHDELIERINSFTADAAKGYVRIRQWNASGHGVFSFAAPGLPVPFEISWGIVDDRLVAAATPSGMVAAIRQLESDGPSISDNAAFQFAVLDHLPASGASSVTFSDTERFARQGYGGTNLILSALANAVRSPSDPDREAGVLMPSFGAFTEGIMPMSAIEYWEGDDYVSVLRMDGSSIVETAEFLGQIGGLNGVVALTAIQASAAMPALGRAREQAKSVKSATQVRALGQAIIMYSMDNDGQLPPSYDVLIDEGLITAEMLESPIGSAWDGKGDIVMRKTIDPALIDSFRADVVVTLDRAAYVNGGQFVNVGFADNHVESLSVWEVDEFLDMDINDGAREDFMLDE